MFSDFAPELALVTSWPAINKKPMWRQNLGEPVLLMTDDVLAKCGSCTTISQGTWEIKAFNAAPIGGNLHFQGHLHCHRPFQELLNQPLTNSGSAAERRRGRRGRKKQSFLYLDLRRVKGRTNKFNATEPPVESPKPDPSPRVPSPLSSPSGEPNSPPASPEISVMTKVLWRYHYMKSAAPPWKQPICPEDEEDIKYTISRKFNMAV